MHERARAGWACARSDQDHMGKVNRIWLLCVYNRRGQHVAHGEGVNLWLRCGGVTQSSSCSSHCVLVVLVVHTSSRMMPWQCCAPGVPLCALILRFFLLHLLVTLWACEPTMAVFSAYIALHLSYSTASMTASVTASFRRAQSGPDG